MVRLPRLLSGSLLRENLKNGKIKKKESKEWRNKQIMCDAFNCMKGLGSTSHLVQGKWQFFFKIKETHSSSVQFRQQHINVTSSWKLRDLLALSQQLLHCHGSRPAVLCFLASSWWNRSRRFCSQAPRQSYAPRQRERKTEQERANARSFVW